MTMRFSPILSLCLMAPLGAASAEPSITLNAAEEPESMAWTQPAAIAYTSRKGAKDSWALDAALKLEFQGNTSSTLFLAGAVQRNTQSSKEVENYAAKLGYSFDWDNAGHGPASPAPNLSALYLFGDVSVGINRKTVFADPQADCAAMPKPSTCSRQHETSLRGAIAVMPFMSAWENTFFVNPESSKLDGPAFTHSIIPVVTLFVDDVIDAQRGADGTRADGQVAGAKFELKAAFSPRFTDYRLVLSGGVQHTEVVARSRGRKDGFERSSTFFSLSADYEFGPRSFESVGGFIPAFGITYQRGDDPFNGRQDQDNLIVGLKLSYRAPTK